MTKAWLEETRPAKKRWRPIKKRQRLRQSTVNGSHMQKPCTFSLLCRARLPIFYMETLRSNVRGDYQIT
jgi:hypothetical protein